METEDTEKKTSAKNTSKFAMVLATIWILSMTVCKVLFHWDITQHDIVFTGLAIVVIWSPVYLSIWIDKFVGGKNG